MDQGRTLTDGLKEKKANDYSQTLDPRNNIDKLRMLKKEGRLLGYNI